MNAAYTGENRRSPDRRVLPAAEASAAHFQRKAAEERADMLADQLADCRAQVLPLEKQVDSLQIQIDRLHAQRSELLAALRDLSEYDSYDTEYDGRMLQICPSCGKQGGNHSEECEFVAAKALIAKAAGSANHG